MGRIGKISAEPMFLIISNIPVVTLSLLLILPVLTKAQSDPLSPSYMPRIDTNPADYPSNIWVTDTMQKVRQDRGSPGTQHWGTFYGTQNEFVDFQVHVQAPSGGIANLTVTASNFVTSAPSSYAISASSPNVIVYREAYLDITTLTSNTSGSALYYGATGYYPDILIPTVDPYYDQTTNAWPFTVAASQNQSAWIDVHIPPAAPSGYYLGSITVKSGSTTLATMPVIIAVWQWPSAGNMPSTSSLHSWTEMGSNDACIQFFGGYSSCGSYPGASGSADKGVELSIIDVGVLMLDHRWSAATPMYTTQSFASPGADIATYWEPFWNGTAAHTQTILAGAKEREATYPYTTGGITSQGSTVAQNWATYFSSAGYTNFLLAYSADEPPATPWATVLSNANILHGTRPMISALGATDIAHMSANSALNAVDIIAVVTDIMECASSNGCTGFESVGNQRSSYNNWLAGNCCGAGSPPRQLWSYISNDSQDSPTPATWPNYDIDSKPVGNRMNEWLTFKNTQTGELYFDITYAWSNGTETPWTTVYYFGGNGDGTLVYPSSSKGTNYVTAPGGRALANPIFLPSIRLKNIRDGMQDYEYLNILNNNGQGSLVTTEIDSWITNSYTFETTGSGLQAARMALGKALHQLSYPAVLLPPTPPTNLTLTVQ